MDDKGGSSMNAGKVQLDSYNRALRKGRHPRSFGRDDTSTLWNALKTSSDRVSNVRFGQTLGSVVDKESPPSASIPMARGDSIALPLPEGRDEGSPSPGGRQSFSRGKGKPSSSPEKRDPLRRGKKKHHHNGNTDDVVRRIQALGSSPTAPALDTKSLAGATASAQPPPPSSSSTSSANANEIDTAKLRNDFSAQSDARIYFGSTVALELFNGDMMMVSVADSTVVVHPLEHIKHQARGARDKLLFTLVNLHELRSANAIKYGDSVWLQISVGTGETSWEQGGVLGAKVRKAPELNALTLTQKRSANPLDVSPDDGDQEPDLLTNVGFPVPVKAYLPKSREDTTDSQIDDMQARLRNKASRMLGRWIIRSAVANPAAKDNYVYNNQEIYLEQDWFYLGADTDPMTKGPIAVLRQLPPPKNHKPGEYIIERRTAWKVRLVDSSNGGLGLSLVQQQMERLLFKAKTQLKASERMRDGEARCYSSGLHGGQNFPKQIRQHIQSITATSDQACIGLQQDRVNNLNAYFVSKIAAMDESVRGKKTQLSPLGRTNRPLRSSASALTLDSGLTSGSSALQGTRSMVSLSSTSPSTASVHVCNLCVSNRRFDLCTHDHDVSRLLSTGAPLQMSPSTGPNYSRAASDRSLLSTAEQAARAKQIEAADMRERDRIMRMLGDQDARLIGVIKTSEHQMSMAAIQRRTHHDFTDDDVPHFINKTSMRHKRHAPPPPEDGLPDIDELRRHLTEAKPKPLFADDDEEEDVREDEPSDVESGEDEGQDSAASSDTDDDFITEDEIQTLDFVNVDKASALYANDEKALLEMLVGFADLALNRVVPQLQEALASHNKASLLETADFLARAAEYVVARRIQVHVMGLIQSVATSNVDDFTGIEPSLNRLVKEVEGTAHFVEKFAAKHGAHRPVVIEPSPLVDPEQLEAPPSTEDE